MTDASAASDYAALNAAAMAALRGRRFAEAAMLLDQAVALAPREPSLWLNQAALKRAQGDPIAAMASVDQALRIEPRHFMALLMRASLLERLGRHREAGPAYGTALGQAPPDDLLDAATRRAVDHARAVNQAHGRELAAFFQERIAGMASSPSERRRADQFTDALVGRRRPFRQEPIAYHYPAQPAIEFWDRDEFPWLETFESATPKILDELKAWAAGSDERTVPYINFPDTAPLDQWAELNTSRRWSALHLYNYGRRDDASCALFPATMEALALLPQPRIQNRSPSVMFSVLEPHTHIPAHTGVSNTRLVVHLPLIVPDNCRFRVGNETRPWRVGEAWVFDDTIEHEAWNDSDQRRIILICDIWSPRLSAAEREFITVIMTAMDDFNGVAAPSEGNAL